MNVTHFRHTPHHFLNSSVCIMRKFAMDASSAGKEIGYKEACDSGAKKSFADRIIPHILRLYGSCVTSHDFEIYARDASFEDPLMCAQGVKQIKSAFYSLPKVFSESKIVEYSVEENMVSPGKGEILIDNKQYYKFLGKDIDMVSLIKLYVEEGKAMRTGGTKNQSLIETQLSCRCLAELQK